jgi:hypothetical protein
MNSEFLKSRLGLILLGISLGWIARLVLGAPFEAPGPPRTINRPIESVSDDPTNDPGSESNSSADSQSELKESGGLVPPIQLPGTIGIFGSHQEHRDHVRVKVLFDEQSHDEDAFFEAHGEQQCASGCAVSRHPTAELTEKKFDRLIKRISAGEMDETNQALEELIYFGGQTRKLIEANGVGELEKDRAAFLWDQLSITHAKISIRVKDETGDVRTWIEPTLVPFDRRHIFDMETNNVQPLVTSGTIKRVGQKHLWTRL